MQCNACTPPPRRLERSYSARQYWNYLRRQLYVLDTYSNAHNRALNRTMMCVHCWAGAVLVAALVLAGAAGWACAAGTASCLLGGIGSSVGSGSSSSSGGVEGDAVQGVGYGTKVLLGLIQGLLSSAHVAAGGCTGSGGLAAVQQCIQQAAAVRMPAASTAVLLCLAAAAVALRYMVCQVSALLLHLHPCDAELAVQLGRYSCTRMWAGLLVECVVSPACMLYTYRSPYITWAGVRYAKRDGKVHRVS
jgi:hypothetical protein